MKIEPANEEGVLTIDWASSPSSTSDIALTVFHAGFAPWTIDEGTVRRTNWQLGVNKVDVSLVKGDQVTIAIEDLRTEGTDSNLSTLVGGVRLKLASRMTNMQMNWTKRTFEQVHLSADQNVFYGPELPSISKEQTHVKFTVCDRRFVQGYLRDKLTGQPLARRRISAYATRIESLRAQAITEEDGYFRISVPAVDSELKFVVWPLVATSRGSNHQLFSRDSLANPIELTDTFDLENQLEVKSMEDNAELVYAISTGDLEPDYIASGTLKKIEYHSDRYKHRNLFGFNLRTAMFGISEAMVDPASINTKQDESILRELRLKPANVLRGRLVNEQGDPIAWQLFSIRTGVRTGLNFTQVQWTSSFGRFASSALPQNHELQLGIEGLKEINVPALTESQDVGDVILRQRTQFRIPVLDYYVDRWINGSVLPVDQVNRKIPILVVHDTFIPVSTLKLLSLAYPKDKLTILVIHYPGLVSSGALRRYNKKLPYAIANFLWQLTS